STWLRDYVYIPIGGNRKGTKRTYVNNFITMLVGGLWHGAAWRFVFWGAMHGAGLAVHKASKPWLKRCGDSWPIKALAWFITMAFVMAMWVFFRADSWGDAATVIGSVFRNFDLSYAVPFAAARTLWLILMLVIIISHCLPARFWHRLGTRFVLSPWIVKLIVFLVTVQLVIELRSESVTPFIYFNF
ncbi:MAG: MBOAT family protein, partial [Muribaculaceae bacterium]|nr:MBOAT family protein [Muribaculaceae bacterium]